MVRSMVSRIPSLDETTQPSVASANWTVKTSAGVTPGGSADLQDRPLSRVSERPFAVSTQPELGSTIAAARTFVPGGFPLTAHKADAAEEHEVSSLVGLLTGPWVRAHDTDVRSE